MTFTRNYRTISRSGRVIARFDEIRKVGIKVYKDEGVPFSWAVRLRVSWWRTMHLGRTRDDVTASICAAHVSTIMGKPVATC
jgi:hypothetical protein